MPIQSKNNMQNNYKYLLIVSQTKLDHSKTRKNLFGACQSLDCSVSKHILSKYSLQISYTNHHINLTCILYFLEMTANFSVFWLDTNKVPFMVLWSSQNLVLCSIIWKKKGISERLQHSQQLYKVLRNNR